MFDFLKRKRPYEEYSAAGFEKKLIENPKAVVLDVRSAAEFREGHLRGAVNLNVADTSFAGKIAQLDKSKTYCVYCRSGVRSAQACSIMAQNGFGQVCNLAGGLMAWQGKLVR